MLRHTMKKRFTLAFMVFAMIFSSVTFSGCYKSEVERLRKEVQLAQDERDNLKKQIELLSNTVKQLADLNALNQSTVQKKEVEDQTVTKSK